MRTCLVTGGAGFIGSHLAGALVDRGDKVRVLDNFSTGTRRNLEHLEGPCEVIAGDLLDRRLVADAMGGVDCVFHQAALASVPRSVARPWDTHRACASGTLTVLDEARKAGVRRVVYAASSSAYGNRTERCKREDDPPAPLSPYAAAKLAGEYYCQAYTATYGLETVSLRYFNVFGPRQDPNSEYSAVIPRFVSAMLDGRRPTVYGDGRQSRDFTYIDNVVQGNLMAADAPGVAGFMLNLACGQEICLLELIATINGVLGTDVQPEFADPRPGDVRSSRADITRAKQLLGYAPHVDFEEGLRRSIDYYRGLST